MGPRARARGNSLTPADRFGDLAASMGPRARARGNPPIGEWTVRVPKLQWGHERALVEIKQIQTMFAAFIELQWGHERALVEIQP